LIGAIAVWGHLGDRVLGRKLTLQVCTVVAIGVAVGVGLPVPPLVLGLLVVAFNCSQGVLLALADAVAVNSLRDPGSEYGRIRLLASLSFAIATIAAGFLYDRLGYSVASLVYVAFALLLVAAALGTEDDSRRSRTLAPVGRPAEAAADLSPGTLPAAPDSVTGSAAAGDPASPFGSTGLAFRTQPRLLPVLATVAVTWFAIVVSFTFLSLRIVGLGGQASDVALSFGVSAFAEIPGMLLAARLASRIGLRGLFCVGAVAFGVAFLSWAVLTSPAAIVATRALTGLAYGALTVAMVLTIGQLLPGSLQATGQTLYQGTATGIAAVAGNVAGGYLYGSAGPSFLFVVCGAMCVAGGLLALFTLPGRVRLSRPGPERRPV
jgi:MFS family permease